MPPDLPLKDIHLPAPIGWWPPAPGWWLLLFGLPALAFLLVWLWRFLRRQTPRKLALRELDAIARSEADTQTKIRQIATLLRRVSLSVYPREAVAGLVGADWLAFLDASLKDRPFSEGAGRLLIDAPYRRETPAELDALLGLCRDWLTHLPKSSKAARQLLQRSAIANTNPAVAPSPIAEPEATPDPRRFARPESLNSTTAENQP